jgi:hypothetical protein
MRTTLNSFKKEQLAEIQARSLPKTCVKILILHNQDTLHSNLFSLGKLAESAPSCIIESQQEKVQYRERNDKSKDPVIQKIFGLASSTKHNQSTTERYFC